MINSQLISQVCYDQLVRSKLKAPISKVNKLRNYNNAYKIEVSCLDNYGKEYTYLDSVYLHNELELIHESMIFCAMLEKQLMKVH